MNKVLALRKPYLPLVVMLTLFGLLVLHVDEPLKVKDAIALAMANMKK